MHESKQIAAAIIADPQARLLLQLRDDKPTIGHPNHWGLFGGTVEPGETPKDAAVREVCEELSIDVRAENFRWLGEYVEAPHKKYHVFAYVGGDELQDAVLTEGQRIGRFKYDELEHVPGGLLEGYPIIPIVERILRDYLKRVHSVE